MDNNQKKTITISIPCRNEENNILNLVTEIEKQFKNNLPEYNYFIQFSDNCSDDKTREILRDLCKANPHIRAIFNVSNVSGSAIHSLLQAEGDCCIHMASDFQDPPELIPELIKKWENNSVVVCAIKTSSQEKKIMWCVRSIYYKLMCKLSVIPQIEHFTGFGLYDRQFIEIIRRIDDPVPTLRGYVAEYGHKVEKIYFNQPRRKRGRSGKTFWNYFDYSMGSFTTYTRIGIHMFTICGVILAFLSIIILLLLFGLTLFFDINLPWSTIIPVIAISFLASVQFFFTGIIGEYILNITRRIQKRPLAIEAERLGFGEKCMPKPDNISPYIAFSPTDDVTESVYGK